MLGKKAREYYLGEGGKRLGCAYAVAEALREKAGLEDAFISSMAHARGGRAPEGYCGAVYAAMSIAKMKLPGKEKDIESFFKNEAGSLKCREILSKKKISCADCVENAARIVASGEA